MNQLATLWYDQNFRRLFFQVLAVLAIAYFGYFIFDNTSTNLKRLNIQPGFDFMNEIAGFMPTTDGMNLTGFDLNTSTHKDVLIVGIFNTLLLAVVGIILATILGFIMGILRLSSNLIISFISSTFSLILVLLLLWFEGYGFIDSFISTKYDGLFIQSGLFFLVLMILNDLIKIPF